MGRVVRCDATVLDPMLSRPSPAAASRARRDTLEIVGSVVCKMSIPASSPTTPRKILQDGHGSRFVRRPFGLPSIADIVLRRREPPQWATSGRGSEARVQAPAGLRPPRLATFDGVTGAA
jgi:hypothetical protein